MIADQLPVRQARLEMLEAFCQALDRAFTRAGLAPEKSDEAWRVGVAAECVRCGIRIYGEELHALSRPPAEEYANAKIGRLRLGDCARSGCDSYYYRLTFYPCPEVNWAEILAAIERDTEESAGQKAGEPAHNNGWRLLLHSSATRRVGVALAVVVILLVVRQWYIGGRIPLLREPHKFQVSPESTQFATH